MLSNQKSVLRMVVISCKTPLYFAAGFAHGRTKEFSKVEKLLKRIIEVFKHYLS